MYKDNWDKLEHLWQIEVTDEVKKEVLEIGEQKFWGNYYLQQQFAKKHNSKKYENR